MIWPQNVCFVHKHNMTANFIINYGFNQHLEGITRNDHENENVDWEALDFLLVDDFSVEEVKKGQVHVSTSSEDAINKLKDALSVERKKTTLHYQEFITHQTKVKDSKK